MNHIATSGDPTSNLDNSVAGVDFRYLNSRLPGARSLEGDVWFQQSSTEGLEGDDTALGLGLRLPSNTGMRGELGLMRVEPNFNPALGFVRRRGVDQLSLDGGHTWRPLTGPVRTYFSGIDAERIEYLDNGDVQSQSVVVQALNVELDSQDVFGIGATHFKEGLRQPFMISSGVVIPAGDYSLDRKSVM